MPSFSTHFPPGLVARLKAFLSATPEELSGFPPADLKDLVHELLQATEQLTTRLAHDLRTPLSVLRNNIYYLETLGQPRLPDEIDALAEMRRAVLSSDEILRRMSGGL